MCVDLEGMPHRLSVAGAENSPETLRKWMEVIENSQEEDVFYWQPSSWYG